MPEAKRAIIYVAICALIIIVPDYIITFIVLIAFLNRITAAKLKSGNKVTLTR